MVRAPGRWNGLRNPELDATKQACTWALQLTLSTAKLNSFKSLCLPPKAITPCWYAQFSIGAGTVILRLSGPSGSSSLRISNVPSSDIDKILSCLNQKEKGHSRGCSLPRFPSRTMTQKQKLPTSQSHRLLRRTGSAAKNPTRAVA